MEDLTSPPGLEGGADVNSRTADIEVLGVAGPVLRAACVRGFSAGGGNACPSPWNIWKWIGIFSVVNMVRNITVVGSGRTQRCAVRNCPGQRVRDAPLGHEHLIEAAQ